MSMLVRRFAVAAALLLAGSARALDLSYSALGGFQNGVGTRVVATASELAPGSPLAFSFGVGLAFVDPGNATLARHVFINDNENGTPEKSGTVLDFRLDAIYLLRISSLQEAGLFAGVRYAMYDGRFHYVGGNEDFDVRGRNFAYGAGFRGAVAMSRAWSLAFQAGLDWMPSRSLSGHDATYSSGGTSVNARDNNQGGTYSWSDAARAINYPVLVPSVLVGLTWRP